MNLILLSKALIVAALVALAAFAVHRIDLSRQEIGYQKAVSEYQVKLIAAQEDARAQEAAWQSKQKQEQEKTNERLNQRDSLYAATRRDADGLRNTITNLGNGLPSITAGACSARIGALSAVFGECTERLTEMASHAQGQFIDALSCRESWPQN